MGNLYVIRHGQTTCNSEGILQGPRIDSDLSDLGRVQAEALAGAFTATHLDALYCSPMRRARATAAFMAEARPDRLDTRIVPETYEVDYGTFCGQRIDDVRDGVMQVLDAWGLGFVDQTFPGGESAVVARLRLRTVVEKLRDEAVQRDVALVAHGRINRILVAALTDTPLSQQARFPQDNANITHLEVDEDHVRVRRVNDTAHLPSNDPAFS